MPRLRANPTLSIAQETAPRFSARRVFRSGLIAAAITLAYGGTIDPDRGLAGSAAQAQAESVRAEVGKVLQAARDLIKQNRHKEALAKLREVDAIGNRTAYENYVTEQMRASAALSAGDNEQALKSMQFMIGSGRLSEAEQGRYAASIAGLLYRAKDYSGAATWSARALKSNPADAATRALMIQSYFLAGDYATASKEALADVQAAEKAGQKPAEEKLQLLANIASRNTADKTGYITALEKLVAYYPKREYWADLLARIQAKPGFSSRLQLDVYRLRVATKTVTSGNDLVEMAQLALQEGQAGEAKAILDEGFASGQLGKGAEAERQKRLLALATQRAADAPKDLAAAEAEAAAARDSNALVRIGLAYTGLGQLDKGIALIQNGINAGNLRRPGDAQLHLGIALMRAGQKGRAAQAFGRATGADGVTDLARLWTRLP
jgi:hypothetical protein